MYLISETYIGYQITVTFSLPSKIINVQHPVKKKTLDRLVEEEISFI